VWSFLLLEEVEDDDDDELDTTTHSRPVSSRSSCPSVGSSEMSIFFAALLLLLLLLCCILVCNKHVTATGRHVISMPASIKAATAACKHAAKTLPSADCTCTIMETTLRGNDSTRTQDDTMLDKKTCHSINCSAAEESPDDDDDELSALIMTDTIPAFESSSCGCRGADGPWTAAKTVVAPDFQSAEPVALPNVESSHCNGRSVAVVVVDTMTLLVVDDAETSLSAAIILPLLLCATGENFWMEEKENISFSTSTADEDPSCS
jgi:hypothetical protein